MEGFHPPHNNINFIMYMRCPGNRDVQGKSLVRELHILIANNDLHTLAFVESDVRDEDALAHLEPDPANSCF